MSRILSAPVLAALLAIGLLVLASPLRAEGKLETIEKFVSDKAEMIVATYLDPGEDAAKNRVGLIGIGAPKRNSFAFDPKEWEQLMALCDKAIAAVSTNRSGVGAAVQAAVWSPVGTMTETGTTDVSKIAISAGPGVRFVISSPKGLTVTYVLQKADAPRFQKALGQVRDFLARK